MSEADLRFHAFGPAGRIAAALIALAGWSALTLQAALTIGLVRRGGGTLADGLVLLAGYFTILTNLIVAATLTAIAAGRSVGVSLIGAATLFIAIVGLVYSLVLRALWSPQGWQKVADMALHDVVPLGVVAFWFIFVPKGGLAWRDPFAWLAFPLAYFVYALLRGTATGWWAYPFLNADALGYAAVLRNAAILTATFLGLGLALVALDRCLGGRAR